MLQVSAETWHNLGNRRYFNWVSIHTHTQKLLLLFQGKHNHKSAKCKTQPLSDHPPHIKPGHHRLLRPSYLSFSDRGSHPCLLNRFRTHLLLEPLPLTWWWQTERSWFARKSCATLLRAKPKKKLQLGFLCWNVAWASSRDFVRLSSREWSAYHPQSLTQRHLHFF